MVLLAFMSDYSAALARYLDEAGNNQAELAERVGTTQASISRYKGGRLPPREIAVKIEEATGGRVPLALWIAAAARKIGLAA
jgi:transcriptional regulator with XRE-family HTH domain